ncbi:tRNA 4-thiouridine(8) synthase ThiI [Psittacicella melopsittaci]|uniref:tRNA sulfurtransferase n=1 Tax=Psittacicella melopsittaci TaxID=2028576 RepID=A0A3A1YCW3_9GAMM|nr:tRNA uracil 4-sulfurtransferase ThiI [Psittacicella melopsittaci]RIY34054.1 tRNA 4-thiouridine(8) synthase ThiI [Psittacicella melopsittaci]
MYLRIKLHPEIVTKSDSVRKRFVKILSSNIRQSLKTYNLDCSIQPNWDNILVRAKCDPALYPVFVQILRQVPGIQKILKIKLVPFVDMHQLFEEVLKLNAQRLQNKTFCVRVKRKGKHQVRSIDIERYVGGGLRQNIPGASVNLTKPEETVQIEIDNEQAFLIEHSFSGLGGFPIGTQDAVLSMISGGYDSAVSSWQMIRRGCKLHYVFFNLGGQEHEYYVKRIARKIWQGYSASHNVKFVTVDFYPIMLNIANAVSDGYTGVCLKRMFYRVANAIARRLRIDGLVTGEALGQVSSQTLKNLAEIERVSEIPVLRPLIAMDKEEIIRIAQQIQTAEISARVQEFCGIMGKKPTIAADRATLEQEESKLDIEALVAQALDSAKVESLRDIASQDLAHIESTQLTFVHHLNPATDVVIDVRDAETFEQANNPWPVSVLNIPFFALGEKFAELDQSKRYVLYCTKGLLSRIQAVNLIENGHKNVVVLAKDFSFEDPLVKGQADDTTSSLTSKYK